MMAGVLRGVHPLLEAEADRILAEHFATISKHSEKMDVLTPWKMKRRRWKEVYVPSGTPDGSVRHGNFNRVANPSSPHLNSRLGTSTQGRRETGQRQTGLASDYFDE